MFSRPLSKQAKLEYLYQKVHRSTAAEYRFSTFSEEGGGRVLEKASLTLSHIRLLYTIVFPMLLTLWAYQLIRCGSRSLQPQWHSHRLS